MSEIGCRAVSSSLGRAVAASDHQRALGADQPPSSSPSNWKSADLAASQDRWVHGLSTEEISNLHKFLARHRDRSDDLSALTPPECELPALAPRLASIRQEPLDGCGVALLRGLAIDQMSLREAATA